MHPSLDSDFTAEEAGKTREGGIDGNTAVESEVIKVLELVEDGKCTEVGDPGEARPRRDERLMRDEKRRTKDGERI